MRFPVRGSAAICSAEIDPFARDGSLIGMRSSEIETLLNAVARSPLNVTSVEMTEDGKKIKKMSFAGLKTDAEKSAKGPRKPRRRKTAAHSLGLADKNWAVPERVPSASELEGDA